MLNIFASSTCGLLFAAFFFGFNCSPLLWWKTKVERLRNNETFPNINMYTQWCLQSPNSLEEELFCLLEAWMYSFNLFLLLQFCSGGRAGGGEVISPLFARRGQYVVVFILGHVLSDDRPQSVPGPCCDSQLDLDAMAGLSGCLNGCHSRAWHGVSRGLCCQPIRCPAVLFRVYT